MIKKNSIIQGNSLELLKKIPDKSVDLVFADPPYNLQLKDTLYRPDQTTVEAVTNDWDKFDTYQAYDLFCLEWLKECKRILKNGVVLTAQVGSIDKKPKQVKNWCKVLEKSFGNVKVSGVHVPSFDCNWNFASSIMK